MWTPGAEHRSPARAASDPNHWAISLVPRFYCLVLSIFKSCIHFCVWLLYKVGILLIPWLRRAGMEGGGREREKEGVQEAGRTGGGIGQEAGRKGSRGDRKWGGGSRGK